MYKITANMRAALAEAIKNEFGYDDPDYAQLYFDALADVADGTELSPTSAILDDGDVDPKIDPHGALVQSIEYFGLQNVVTD